MKNFKITTFLIAVFFSMGLTSCSNDDDSSSSLQPVITEVNGTLDGDGNVIALEPLTQGFANNMYVIRGTGLASAQNIYFNDKDTYFNPTLVTDNAIFVTIDKDTPFFETIDELKVVTKTGTAVFTFKVLPAAPIIRSYNSINPLPGDIVTIYGEYFLEPVITVGTTEATIVSATVSEIQFELPADSQFKYVTVTTESGSATSTQAIGTALYDDALTSLVSGAAAWGGTPNFAFEGDAVQGIKSIRHEIGGYSGLQFDVAGVPTATYMGIRVSIKAAKAGKVQIIMNGNFNPADNVNIFDLTTEWKTFIIPFDKFGFATTPASLTQITFQEWGAPGGNTYIIDDLGLVLQN